ncbi:type I-E CRISPR-associated protein Cse2/CasB [Umezawaea sp. Da 62-37]|uniref:type I-E CRISPR-associated protein Cse2/CasB n=1 Tax=Umezawaea sp. Da 62-37 TaxID=3075927 RepID=UPI0028F716FB|nr:type I-E CRISPR-associated protein Cse2/CasB [Umezawaea sp. Da 62-37]WNV85007.1 type I-E CRISPR-associated protein Cse2/CasB [Umezawaea sp. Da 62-37]
MSEPRDRRAWYWETYVDDQGHWKKTSEQPEGRDLAALRRGLGRLAGSVPQMWPYYRSVIPSVESPRLDAEHAALSLYGLHQQSQRNPMHKPGIGLGEALRQLKNHDGVSEEAVTRRFNAAATATSIGELVAHLRGLVTQLRGKDIALDYTRLRDDLLDWINPTSQSWVRRRWGMQYHAWHSAKADEDATA